MDYIIKREFHHTVIRDNIAEDMHVLRIYNKSDASILSESELKHFESEIRLIYDDLEYVSQNKEIENETLITLESLINKFKKNE